MFLQDSLCRSFFRSCFWLAQATFLFFVFCCVFGLLLLGFLSLILVPLNSTLGSLDSGSAVRTYTCTQMWIRWTLGWQSIAQTCRPTIKSIGFMSTSFHWRSSGIAGATGSNSEIVNCKLASTFVRIVLKIPLRAAVVDPPRTPAT